MGAAISLAKVMDKDLIPGEIVVFGSLSEEDGGGKIRMADEGVFEGFTCAMMIHPSTQNLIARHLDGVNALSSLPALFQGIDSLKHT